MAVRVDNHTEYGTRYLRGIFAKCLSEIRKTETRSLLSRMRVEVRYIHSRSYAWVSGYAYYHRNFVLMRVPRPGPMKDGVPPFFGPGVLRSIAKVFIHEVGHCLGKRHRRGLTIEHLYGEFLDKHFAVPLAGAATIERGKE